MSPGTGAGPAAAPFIERAAQASVGIGLLVYVSTVIEVKREGTNVYGILQGFASVAAGASA